MGGGRWKDGVRLGPGANANRGTETQVLLSSKGGGAHESGSALRHEPTLRQIAGEPTTTNISRQVTSRTESIPLIPAKNSE
jgi:hypothetical protein